MIEKILNRDEFLNYILDVNVPLEKRIASILKTTGQGRHIERKPADSCEGRKEIGVVGNVWVRVQHYARAGDVNHGHLHHHDHVSLLAKGKISVTIDDTNEATIFEAPTFFIVKADKKHTITPLEDDTSVFCVFALRGVDGEVVDFYTGDNTPYSAADE